MPHINRIRVNNVKYNFGTQFYDDFVMRFSCKNTIYDLANGGGKSVLMLLLLQNLIPNCTLDDKQPIEKLFRTGSGSNTIHSLVEWKLDEELVKNNYKYMLTGFCARRAKEEDGKEEMPVGGQSIDYFNYCIFYREFNENDIKNFPLNNGKERITYNGLKAYLRELEKKDYSLEIKIFERKGEYQRFISEYGLYESQWEIIRGINKTEGHVRTYFENNYKTTRKVVEDLLIEEIIEKSFKTRVALEEGNEDVMAKTLLNIKDKIIELSKRKEDINNYDRQNEAIESFIGRVSGIKQLYFGKEDLENQIVKTYNTLNQIIIKKEEDLEELKIKQLELIENKTRLNKVIDTIKVQKTSDEIGGLSLNIDELNNSITINKEDFVKRKSQLLMKESENDYLDYIYYKNELEAIKVVIESLTKTGENLDRDKIMLELAAIANEKKTRNDKRQLFIEESLKNEEIALEKETQLLVENAEKEKTYIQEISITDYLIIDYANKLEQLNKEIYEEKSKLDMLMNVNLVSEISHNINEISDIKNELEELNKETIKSAELGKALEFKYNNKEIELNNLEELIEKQLVNKKENDTIQEKISKIEELYGENNLKNLLRVVGERYKDIINEETSIVEKTMMLKMYAKNLEKGCPVGSSKEVETVLDYIEKYHGNVAVNGNEYITRFSKEERIQILEKIPFLPYSIVIKSNYNTITSDGGLKKILEGNYAVPIIKEDALKSKEYILDILNVSFVMRDELLFTDDDAINKEKDKTLNQIKELEEKKERLCEVEEVLQSDLNFIKEYIDVYKDNISKCEREYEESKILRRQIQSQIQVLKDDKLEVISKEEQIKSKYIALNEKLEDLEKKSVVLSRVQALDSKADALENDIRELKQKKGTLSREYGDIKARIEAQKSSKDYRKTQILLMKDDLIKIKNNWNEIYKSYYSKENNIESFEYVALSDEELDAKARGLAEIISSEISDIKDKQKLMENYDIAMEKSLQAIDYKGISVKEIQENYNKGLVKQHSKEELLNLKKSLDELEFCIKKINKEISEKQSSKDKLIGAMIHGREIIEEKYGTYEEIEGNIYSFDRLIEESLFSISQIDNNINKLYERIKNIEETSKDYIIYRRDLDKIIESAHITNKDANNVWEDGIELSEKVDIVSERYEKYKKEIIKRKEEFDYEKNMLFDTLNILCSYQLALEIKNNALMPKDIAKTEELIVNLQEIVSCINLEKERIEKNIQDMEIIKLNFEKQCIQSCLNIKAELDKLPKLSKIYLDGESISIIGLNIPYIKDEFIGEHMSGYIDEIVETSDKLKTEEERIKYIKNQLSWKKLFSVIVTDMNSIKLTLYKRERIKEQSRFLRYEEAVGSTGQSQGIYIQFLIAIINYITSINSGNVDSKRIGKVVFIDNPFGAAKDVYIWEPIFKMLKTNNVQLVVPCRGATPAITGRFDVNYILGQKMIDGKQQTVVVEYYSNVESSNIEYEKLSFEQKQLNFE